MDAIRPCSSNLYSIFIFSYLLEALWGQHLYIYKDSEIDRAVLSSRNLIRHLSKAETGNFIRFLLFNFECGFGRKEGSLWFCNFANDSRTNQIGFFHTVN